MNTWKWVMRPDLSWKLVLMSGTAVAAEIGSVQICDQAESGMLAETGDECVPATNFGFDEQIEEERLPDVWGSEEARTILIFYRFKINRNNYCLQSI
ncbi:hypothetical protein OROHE_009026 [Orobanche hederae]